MESGDLGWPSPAAGSCTRYSFCLEAISAALWTGGKEDVLSDVHRVLYTVSQARQVLAPSRICLTSKDSEGTLECIWDPQPCPVSSFLVKAGKNRL